jgi:hypothetical protein
MQSPLSAVAKGAVDALVFARVCIYRYNVICSEGMSCRSAVSPDRRYKSSQLQSRDGSKDIGKDGEADNHPGLRLIIR